MNKLEILAKKQSDLKLSLYRVNVELTAAKKEEKSGIIPRGYVLDLDKSQKHNAHLILENAKLRQLIAMLEYDDSSTYKKVGGILSVSGQQAKLILMSRRAKIKQELGIETKPPANHPADPE